MTCSGARKDGSLRIIRSGIDIHKHATISDLAGVMGKVVTTVIVYMYVITNGIWFIYTCII